MTGNHASRHSIDRAFVTAIESETNKQNVLSKSREMLWQRLRRSKLTQVGCVFKHSMTIQWDIGERWIWLEHWMVDIAIGIIRNPSRVGSLVLFVFWFSTVVQELWTYKLAYKKPNNCGLRSSCQFPGRHNLFIQRQHQPLNQRFSR